MGRRLLLCACWRLCDVFQAAALAVCFCYGPDRVMPVLRGPTARLGFVWCEYADHFAMGEVQAHLVNVRHASTIATLWPIATPPNERVDPSGTSDSVPVAVSGAAPTQNLIAPPDAVTVTMQPVFVAAAVLAWDEADEVMICTLSGLTECSGAPTPNALSKRISTLAMILPLLVAPLPYSART